MIELDKIYKLWFIHLLSYEGDIILDPFMGSVPAAVATRFANRHYIGFEISKRLFQDCRRKDTRNFVLDL